MHADWKTINGMILYIVLGVVANLLLSHGMRQMQPFTELSAAAIGRFFKYIVTTPTVVLAVAFMAVDFFMLLAVLSWADLSCVTPATAGDYLLTTMFAQWLLHEHVPPARWFGVILVTIGVCFCLATSGDVSPTAKQRKAEAAQSGTGMTTETVPIPAPALEMPIPAALAVDEPRPRKLGGTPQSSVSGA